MQLIKEEGYGLTSNSGGPSSASSGDCSSPILLIKRQKGWFSARKYFKMSEAAGEHKSVKGIRINIYAKGVCQQGRADKLLDTYQKP